MSVKLPIKIVFTGPESSGKTTMAKLAAAAYATVWLPEYARTYLETINRPYDSKDLVRILEGQLLAEQTFLTQNKQNSLLFFDTSFLVLKIWSIYKYGFHNYKIEKTLGNNLPNIYFLCDWQISWEADPLRETPNERSILYNLYETELKELKVPFFELKGTVEERLEMVKKVLRDYC